MERSIQEQMEKIIENLECPKGFACYRSDLKNLCKARDVGLESFVACLIEDPMGCKFSILFGGIFFVSVSSESISREN